MNQRTDSTYVLKILLYLILGTLWIKVNDVIAIPLGLIIGLAYTAHDHFAIDRKIEYAVLLVAALIGLSGAGIYIEIIL